MPLEKKNVISAQSKCTFEKICNALDKKLLEVYEPGKYFRFEFKINTPINIINKVVDTYRSLGWDFLLNTETCYVQSANSEDILSEEDGKFLVYTITIPDELSIDVVAGERYNNPMDELFSLKEKYPHITVIMKREVFFDGANLGNRNMEYVVSIIGDFGEYYNKLGDEINIDINNKSTDFSNALMGAIYKFKEFIKNLL